MMALPFGAWIDKHGARALMTAGSVGASLLVILWSQVTMQSAHFPLPGHGFRVSWRCFAP
jgi:hypothetical protein